jgi:hypothetical protein
MTMETVSSPRNEPDDFFKEVEVMIREREALRVMLIQAVIAEVVGCCGVDAGMQFAKDYTLPSDVELSPWATDAITVLGLRGQETLQ